MYTPHHRQSFTAFDFFSTAVVFVVASVVTLGLLFVHFASALMTSFPALTLLCVSFAPSLSFFLIPFLRVYTLPTVLFCYILLVSFLILHNNNIFTAVMKRDTTN